MHNIFRLPQHSQHDKPFVVMKRSRSQASPQLSSATAVTNGTTRMQQLIKARHNARRALASSMTWVKGNTREKARASSGNSFSSVDLQALIKQIHNDWHKRTLSAMHKFIDAVTDIANFSVSLQCPNVSYLPS